jgi:hypothetical protein
LIVCEFEVHKSKRKIKSKYMRERSKVPTSPQSAQQWQPYLIPKTQNMYVIKEQENTISRDKDNLSSVGTDRPPNH